MKSLCMGRRLGLVIGLIQGIACLGASGHAAPAGSWCGNARGPFVGSGGAVVFFGVGVGNPLAGSSTQAALARGRARTDLAATAKPWIQRLVQDYMARHRAYFGPRDFGGAAEFSRCFSERFAADMAADRPLAAAWKDPVTGLAYAVARMEFSDAWFARYQQALGAALTQRHGQDQPGQTQALLSELAADIASQRASQASLFGPAQAEPALLAQGIPLQE
jgi:hypothetical protein